MNKDYKYMLITGNKDDYYMNDSDKKQDNLLEVPQKNR